MGSLRRTGSGPSSRGGDRRWGADPRARRRRAPRALALVLVAACAAVMTLDARAQTGSPLEPARRAVGELLGPAEVAADVVVSPVAGLPGWIRSRRAMDAGLEDLRRENAALRAQVRASGYERNLLAELEGLTTAARDLGHALVPARVVAYGPSQSFAGTVTIDAGAAAGLGPDMTVVNDDGLVGRVLRVTSTTATVLLLTDPGSTVGARIGESMQMGFLRGRGEVGADAELDLELVDGATTPAEDDTVVTWGSRNGSPYASGIPIGRVTAVYESLRESSQRAVIVPFVDFAGLDVVGVVVPSGTRTDRGLVEADGSIR